MEMVDLRPVARADADELIAGNRASIALHYPWVQPFTDAEGFERYLTETQSDQMVGLVAREAATMRVVGVINLSQIFRKSFQNAYLGFYGIEGSVGRGLMTQAVKLALRLAFHDLELHRVEANVQPGNVRSLALLQRIGFRKEGYSPRYLHIDGAWRDHERWAYLADDFPS